MNNIQETAQHISPENPPPPPARIQYPPGYRFMPTDTELVTEYLIKKINNEPIPIAEINETYLRLVSPKELTEKFPKLGDNEWYFFTPRDRKYPNGQRPNRGSESGYWKATGADKNVYYKDKLVGFRKALVFYEGKPQKGKKTNWIMHEYRVDGCQHQKTTADDMRLDDWVLCRMYEKASRVMTNKLKNQKANANGAAGDAEDIEIDPSQVEGAVSSNEIDPSQVEVAVSSNDNESGDVVAVGGEELQHKYENFAVPENQYQINSRRNLGDWSTINDSSLPLPPYESSEEPVLINGQSLYNYYDNYGIMMNNNNVTYTQAATVYQPQQQQAAVVGYQQHQAATVGTVGYQPQQAAAVGTVGYQPQQQAAVVGYQQHQAATVGTVGYQPQQQAAAVGYQPQQHANNPNFLNYAANSYPNPTNNTPTNFSDANRFRYYKFK